MPWLIDAGKATRWQPGTSGNPGGSSVQQILSKHVRQVLNETDRETGQPIARLVAISIVEEVLTGNAKVGAFAEIMDRTEGKAPQALLLGDANDFDPEKLDEKIRRTTDRLRSIIAGRGRKS